MQGKLYIVATPIGNKDDITVRAISTLTSVDVIAAEDTRVTSKLLGLLSIPKKQIVSINEFSTDENFDYILGFLKEGKSVAYVSDAGTPGISDPGAMLVSYCRKNDIEIIPIPGVSAIATAMSVTGIRESPFLFYGFLPHKKGRKKILGELFALDKNIILYESVHRFLKLLDEILDIDKNQEIFVGRELTKMFEDIKVDTVENVKRYYQENPTKLKGEFVVIIKNNK
jgi:16S rRNA (cytidine1402-2'-O)-methyltransferase